MAESGKPRVRVSAVSRQHQPTNDSFENVAAHLGIGQGVDSMAGQATYTLNPITRVRSRIEWMYRGSWLVGNAVDCVAEDMTRAGLDISTAVGPERIGELQGGLEKRQIWQSLNDLIKWGRLYGGAIGVHLVDGQDMSTPLDVTRVAKSQYRGIVVLDRWSVNPSIMETIQEFGPRMGEPLYYNILSSAPVLAGKKIHYTRVIRYDGVKLPYWQALAEQGWGMSIVERIYDRLVAFDSTTQGTAQLVYRAHLRTMKVEKLRDILAMGGPAEAGLIKMMEAVRKYQSSEGITLIDGRDEYATHSYTFAGLSDVLTQFAQQLSGALQIPLVRLFGQSPAGMNSTGESDVRTYYDLILQQQEARLRAGMMDILQMVWRSDCPGEPKDLNFKFNALWQMNEEERATVAGTVTDSVDKAYGAGIVGRATALRELRQSSDVTGVWSSITDDEIKEAEEQDAEAAEEPPGMDDLTKALALAPGEDKPVPGAKVEDAWSEADHPRKDDGEFTSGGSGGSSGSSSGAPKSFTKSDSGWSAGSGEIPQGTGWGDSPIPEVDKGSNPLVVLTPMRSEAFESRKLMREVLIDVSELTSWQTGVDLDKIRPLTEDYPAIEVAQVNGKLVISNGNHRAVAAWVGGEKQIRAKFVNYDKPEAKKYFKRGSAPATPLADNPAVHG